MNLLERMKLPGFGREGRVAAADFDGRCLRVVLAEKCARTVRVTARSVRELPDGADPSDPQGVGEMLGEELRRLRFRGAGLVLCVPRSQAVLKPVQLPPNTPAQDMAAMVNFQVAKELPFPAEDAVIDFTTESHYDAQAAGADREQGVSVLAAAVRLGVTDFHRRVAHAAEATLLGLALRPYADMCCVETCEPGATQRCFALVHLTASETEIDVISHRSLAFSRAAVKRLPTAGEPDAGSPRRHVEPLVQEIARSLQSYQTVQRGSPIEEVLIAGGTGLEGFAAEQLARRLGVPCRILEPGATGEGEAIASEFVSVLGLVGLRAGAGQMPFDFLNPKRPPVVRDVRKTRKQVAALIAIGLLLGLFAARWLYLGHKQAQLRALLGQKLSLEDEIKDLRAVARRVDALERWRDGDRRWLDQLTRVNALLPSSKELYLTGLDAKADGSVNLVVQARDSGAITRLGANLAGGEYPFRPGQVKTGNNRHGYVYGTTFRVMTSPELASLEDIPESAAEDQPAAPPAVEESTEQEVPPDVPAAQKPAPEPTSEPSATEAEDTRAQRRREWMQRMRARRQTTENPPPELPPDAPRRVWNRPNPMRDHSPAPSGPEEGGQ